MSNLSTAEIKKILKPPVLIITVGNSLRLDDGIGIYIASKVKNVLNAGDKPESIIDKAVAMKPKKVVIIDAADFHGKPGEIRLIDKEHIPETTLSTHAFPLKVIAKILEKDCKAPVYFLGIQPKSVEFGEGLSPKVKKAAEEIIRCTNSIS